MAEVVTHLELQGDALDAADLDRVELRLDRGRRVDQAVRLLVAVEPEGQAVADVVDAHLELALRLGARVMRAPEEVVHSATAGGSLATLLLYVGNALLVGLRIGALRHLVAVVLQTLEADVVEADDLGASAVVGVRR